MSRILVEACVQGIESARAAAEGGADRIELCEDLAVGGVTPSIGTIVVARQHLSIPVHVLIRSRGGDFVYTGAEFTAMLSDIAAVRSAGVAGVVVGVLEADGRIDRGRTAGLVEAAGPLAVTFHKAFDEVPDRDEALETLVELGVGRILTSGGSPSAREGLAELERLHRLASGRIGILAAGRIREADLPGLLGIGLEEVHVGSAIGEPGRTDPALVRGFVGRVRELEHC
ncbi:MAG: copper homeostasis protein CutC [Isosphaeraceae bacterium]